MVFGQQHRLGGQHGTHLLLKDNIEHPIDEGIPIFYPDIFFFFLLGFMKVGKEVVDRFEMQIPEVPDWLDAFPPPPQLLRSLDHVVVVVLGPSKIFYEERHEFFLESLEGGVVLDPSFAKQLPVEAIVSLQAVPVIRPDYLFQVRHELRTLLPYLPSLFALSR